MAGHALSLWTVGDGDGARRIDGKMSGAGKRFSIDSYFSNNR